MRGYASYLALDLISATTALRELIFLRSEMLLRGFLSDSSKGDSQFVLYCTYAGKIAIILKTTRPILMIYVNTVKKILIIEVGVFLPRTTVGSRHQKRLLKIADFVSVSLSVRLHNR